MSFMYSRNNRGPRILPWGTPDSTGRGSDMEELTDYENDWYIDYRKFISCLNLSSDVVSMMFTGKLFHSFIDDKKKECR